MDLRVRHKGYGIVAAATALAAAFCIFYGNSAHNAVALEEQEVPNSASVIAAEDYEETESSAEYEITSIWKADLSEYKDSFSMVDYENVEVEEEKEEETEESSEASEESSEESGEESESGNSAEYAYDPDYSYEGTVSVPQRGEVSNVSVESGNFAFTTYGYGHGVGMSQNGANYYAYYGGWNYQQILQHYYPGTSVGSTGTGGNETLTVNGTSGAAIDIISKVVYNEMGSSMSPEAMKAQAVAAYTYIKYKGGSAGDLRLKSNPPQNVVNCVASVLGQAVYYNGNYALTMFCASSGGSTASCKDVFTADMPYLRSVPSDYDSSCDPNYGTVTAYSIDYVRSTLQSRLGITLSENPSSWISVVEGDGGYAAYVVIDNQVTVKGSDFRSYFGLKSPKFTVAVY